MKNCKWIMAVILVLGLVFADTNASALSPETELLLKLLEKKGIVSAEEANILGEEVKVLETETENIMPGETTDPEGKHYHSVKGLAERIRKIEDGIIAKGQPGTWADRISIGGLVEIEANSEGVDSGDASVPDTVSSDIALATVELVVDADIAKHVKGHVLLKWEGDPVDVDEGFIILNGDEIPFYLNVGKLYVPFGQFESHFISDPMTLEIGETNQSAVMVGFVNDWVELSVAAFNGDVDETGADNHIDGLAGSIILTIPEGSIPNLNITTGMSYISNIADSNGLEGETPGSVSNHVGGFSAFFSAAFKDKLFFEAEYLGATDDFVSGELSFDGGTGSAPEAWNIEIAYAPAEGIELAAKVEGSDGLGNFLPERQYGAAFTYNLFDSTSLALEYLHATFKNDDERDLLTGQLAIEF